MENAIEWRSRYKLSFRPQCLPTDRESNLYHFFRLHSRLQRRRILCLVSRPTFESMHCRNASLARVVVHAVRTLGILVNGGWICPICSNENTPANATCATRGCGGTRP